MASTKFKIITTLETEVLYETANRLEALWRPQLTSMGINLITVDKHSLFGTAINAPITCKDGVVRKLKEIYSEDLAQHITNLVIKRLKAVNLKPVSMD